MYNNTGIFIPKNALLQFLTLSIVNVCSGVYGTFKSVAITLPTNGLSSFTSLYLPVPAKENEGLQQCQLAVPIVLLKHALTRK